MRFPADDSCSSSTLLPYNHELHHTGSHRDFQKDSEVLWPHCCFLSPFRTQRDPLRPSRHHRIWLQPPHHHSAPRLHSHGPHPQLQLHTEPRAPPRAAAHHPAVPPGAHGGALAPHPAQLSILPKALQHTGAAHTDRYSSVGHGCCCRSRAGRRPVYPALPNTPRLQCTTTSAVQMHQI